MASTERGRLLTEAHRQAQYQIRAASLRETVTAARSLNPRRVDETYAAYRARMLRVVARGRGLSSAASLAYYRAFREAEGAASGLQAVRLATALPAGLDTSLRVTGPVAVKQASAAGLAMEQAASMALSSTLGAVGRHVLDGGRDTIMNALRADTDALGVARVTDGDPCAFCAMLAGRGGVYSKEGADFRPHDRCGCQPEPMFERGAIPESSRPYADLWEETSRGKSGSAARRAFADAHNAKRPGARPVRRKTKTEAPRPAPRPEAGSELQRAAQKTAESWFQSGRVNKLKTIWHDYQQPKYAQINGALRTPGSREGAAIRKQIDEVWNLAGTEASEDVYLYRGLLGRPHNKWDDSFRHDWASELADGAEFVEDGVMSTTASLPAARGWLSDYFQSDAAKDGSVIMRVRVPKGTRVVGGHDNTFETMIRPGTRIRVTGRHTETEVAGYAGETTIVEVEVIP